MQLIVRRSIKMPGILSGGLGGSAIFVEGGRGGGRLNRNSGEFGTWADDSDVSPGSAAASEVAWFRPPQKPLSVPRNGTVPCAAASPVNQGIKPRFCVPYAGSTVRGLCPLGSLPPPPSPFFLPLARTGPRHLDGLTLALFRHARFIDIKDSSWPSPFCHAFPIRCLIEEARITILDFRAVEGIEACYAQLHSGRPRVPSSGASAAARVAPKEGWPRQRSNPHHSRPIQKGPRDWRRRQAGRPSTHLPLSWN